MNYALEVSGLQKVYADFSLHDFNLMLPEGSIMGVVGENGAGKSTAFKAILNLIKKDSGNIKFWGKNFSESDLDIKEDIGVMFDEIAYQNYLTPLQLGNIMKQAYKQWDMKKFKDYLVQFELPKDKKVKDFSKGMQAKMSLALALSHNPKLLILDEPTSGLDPIVRDEILDIFLDFVQDERHSILLSSHITSDLEKIADYITFLHKGKVFFSKEKDVMIDRYGILRCGENLLQQIDKSEIIAKRKSDYQWNVLVKDRNRIQRIHKDAVIDKPTIEEIMLLCVKGECV